MVKLFCRLFLLFAVALLFYGCSGGGRVRSFEPLNAGIERDAVYVIPFDTTLVPNDFGEPVFNDFVDRLNAQRKATKIGRFVILKQDMKDVEPAWLIKQFYISGDMWGYLEKSGCCSTEISVKSRIYLYEPGKNESSLEILLPEEEFFEHDKTTVSAARVRLGKRIARNLADAIIKKLTP